MRAGSVARGRSEISSERVSAHSASPAAAKTAESPKSDQATRPLVTASPEQDEARARRRRVAWCRERRYVARCRARRGRPRRGGGRRRSRACAGRRSGGGRSAGRPRAGPAGGQGRTAPRRRESRRRRRGPSRRRKPMKTCCSSSTMAKYRPASERGHAAVDERPPDDHVELVEPVAEDGDADGDR